MVLPRWIEFPVVKGEKEGALSFCQNKHVPFEIKRVYWIYDFEKETARGGHAHIHDEQILICLHGKMDLKVYNNRKVCFEFHLDSPSKGVYLPKMLWRETKLYQNAVVVSLASCLYDPSDYIRDFDEFLSYGR